MTTALDTSVEAAVTAVCGNDGWALVNVGQQAPEAIFASFRSLGFKEHPSHEGAFSPVDTKGTAGDFSRTANDFDFHTDGLYEPRIPDIVALHCVHAGSGSTRTILSDSAKAVEAMTSVDKALLQALEVVYIGRDGSEYGRPLVTTAEATAKAGIELASRGYLRPRRLRPDLGEHITVRDIAGVTARLLSALEDSICATVDWREGDLLVFDNHRFPHARRSSDGKADELRLLHRLWVDFSRQ